MKEICDAIIHKPACKNVSLDPARRMEELLYGVNLNIRRIVPFHEMGFDLKVRRIR